MSELAAQWVDRDLPHVPIRQWVFTVPVPVRYQLAFDAALTRGAVTAIQRAGGTLNANVHFHSLVLDGLYTRSTPPARPVFHRVSVR